MNWQEKQIMITGGGGFLGRYLIESLVKLNCRRITSLGRSPQAELTAKGINVVCGDIADFETVSKAAAGADIVFHTAAKASIWGPYKTFYNTNVRGTGNVIRACKAHNIPILINTSSPSVVSSEKDIENGDESIPYPKSYLTHYPATKAEAEKMVTEAVDEGFRTLSLRPHLIWGPRDPHILPRLLAKAGAGRLMQVGDGMNRVDLTYVENAAHAHIKAAEQLAEKPELSGKKFFISDDGPVLLWKWIADMLEKLDLPPVNKQISYVKARKIGKIMEMFFKVLHLPGEPPMTRFVAAQLAHSHFFDISAAKKDLGYAPIVTEKKAIENTIAYFANKLK